MFTAGGRGERPRRREVPLVNAWLLTLDRMVGGVIASNCSSSDFSLASFTRVGVCGGGDELLSPKPEFVELVSHKWGVSGVIGGSEESRSRRFGRTIFSCG